MDYELDYKLYKELDVLFFFPRVFSRGVSFYLERFLIRQHCTKTPIKFYITYLSYVL
jgi:hypothetical protein